MAIHIPFGKRRYLRINRNDWPVIVAVILILGLLAVTFILKKGSTETKNTSTKNVNNDTVQQNANTERPAGDFVGYSIHAREKAGCTGATYTLNRTNDNYPVAHPIEGFVAHVNKGQRILVGASEAKKEIIQLTNAASEINKQYKFGEISEKEREEKLVKAIGITEEKIKSLKLPEWNTAIEKAKANYNSTIVHGFKEDCFDRYIISALTVGDYVNINDLKKFGL